MLNVLPFEFQAAVKRGVAIAVMVVLAACGGGGGAPISTSPGDGTTPTAPPVTPSGPAQYIVSGAISVLSTAAVDSDTNDPTQTYTINDSFGAAQTISNPVLLTGHLHVKDRGLFAGPNRDRGDLLDTYKVTLQAGQTIELDFSADPAQFDIDLLLFDATGTFVIKSADISRYECIRVSQTGAYFIGVDVFDNPLPPGSDSVYQLRISAPGGGSSSCVNSSAAGSTVIPGEIIAEPNAQALNSLSQGRVLAGMSAELGLTIKAGKPQDAGPMLYGLPASASERATRMASMQTSARGLASAAKTSQPAFGYARRNDPGINPESALILDTLAYAKLMQQSGQFKYAEPNMRVQSFQAIPTLVDTLPSNDQEYSRQKWHYDMISLPLAMQTLFQMSPQPMIQPIVAVIDTGIVSNHPDLQNKVNGYDFVSSITGAADGDGDDTNPDDSSPANSNTVFHGSHVAGTIAAEGFNSVGGLGVAPMALIMPLRALGAGGSGSSFDVIQAVRFAAKLTNRSGTFPERKADVINLSLGGTGTCPDSYKQLFAEVRAQGTIVVAASGNESASGVVDVGTPANCPGVIAVGAVNAQRSRSYYSNGGPTLAVVAPGGDIRVSTTGNGQPDGIFSTVAQFSANGARQSTYAYLQGTSMASPHMAGVVALMRWVNPSITPDAVDALIRNGSITEDLGAAGRDNLYGYGLINAKRAVDEAIASLGNGGTPPPPVQGRIEASPSGIDLGSMQTVAEFVVQRVGATTDTVASVTTTSNVISVTAKTGAVDANGLGTYQITANRDNVAAGQTAFSSVVVTTASGRTISVNVSLSKPGAGIAAGGNLGVIYVLALNADGADPSLAPVGLVSVVQPVNGVYSYAIKVTPPINGPAVPQKIFIVAGSDLDNDGKICNRGEACGAYPFLDNDPTPISISNASTTGIDFSISPFGGINPSSLKLGTTPSLKQIGPSSLGIGKQR